MASPSNHRGRKTSRLGTTLNLFPRRRPDRRRSTNAIVEPAASPDQGLMCTSPDCDTFSAIEDQDHDQDHDQDGAVEAQRAQDGVVGVGSIVPDFSLTGVDGKTHRLSEFRGRKVMLCFYRKTTCPACAYTVSKLIGNYKKLAWASKLTVITVFRTDHDSLREGLMDEHAPIRKLAGIGPSGYPFLGLADPRGTAASAFRVHKKEPITLGALLSSGSGHTRRAIRQTFRRGVNGEDTLLPSEFLIDEDGVVVDVLRGRKKDESMALSRVASFLLRDYAEQRMAFSSPSRNTRHTWNGSGKA